MFLRTCILLFGAVIFYRRILSLTGPFVSFRSSVASLIIYLDDLFIEVSGILMSPTIVLLSISPFCLLISALYI